MKLKFFMPTRNLNQLLPIGLTIDLIILLIVNKTESINSTKTPRTCISEACYFPLCTSTRSHTSLDTRNKLLKFGRDLVHHPFYLPHYYILNLYPSLYSHTDTHIYVLYIYTLLYSTPTHCLFTTQY